MKLMLLSILVTVCLYWLARFVATVIAETNPMDVILDTMLQNHPIYAWIVAAWLVSIFVSVVATIRFIILL